jgi:hypothetical protein
MTSTFGLSSAEGEEACVEAGGAADLVEGLGEPQAAIVTTRAAARARRRRHRGK